MAEIKEKIKNVNKQIEWFTKKLNDRTSEGRLVKSSIHMLEQELTVLNKEFTRIERLKEGL